ncbi:MAG: NAD-binding protein [Thermodesulfobacteriota bacterium]
MANKDTSPGKWRLRAREWSLGEISAQSVWQQVRYVWRNYSGLIIGLMWVGVLLLGYFGFKWQYEAEGKSRPFSDLVYLTLQLLTLQCGHLGESTAQVHSTALNVARFLIPFLGAFTAGTALMAIFRDKGESLRLRLFYRDHIVICGLGRKGFLFAKAFLDRGEQVVVIENDEDNDFIQQCRDMRALVLIGDAVDQVMLAKANVQKARRMLCVCREDGTNAEIGFRVREMVTERSESPLLCQMHIFSPQLCELLRDRLPEMEKVPGSKLEYFNVFKNGAWGMLNEFSPYDRAQMAEKGSVHILIVGLGWIGESVVVQAAVKWRWHETSGIRPKITIVDLAAGGLKDALLLRYPYLMDAFDIKALEMDVQSAEFQRGDYLGSGGYRVSAAYVCLDDPSLALTAALSLHRCVKRNFPEEALPIVVKMDHGDGLAKVLPGNGSASGEYARLFAFGLLDKTCRPELIHGDTAEILAQQAHRRYLESVLRVEVHQGGPMPAAMKPWEELAPEYQESNRNSARHIPVKLERVGCVMGPVTERHSILFEFTTQEVEILAQMEHERWYEFKAAQGYVWGRVRDDDKKESPHLRHWEYLNESQKEMSRETIRDIPKLLDSVDLEIYRAG